MGASTVRMSDELHQRLNAWAREEGRSFNDLVVEMLEQGVRHRERRTTIDRIIQFGDTLAAKYGQLPDSMEEIRAMREERAARG